MAHFTGASARLWRVLLTGAAVIAFVTTAGYGYAQHLTTVEPKISVQQLLVPSKARVELEKSAKAYRKGDKSAAITHVNRALEIYPSFANALAWRGLVLSDERDRREEACADLEKAIQYDPDLPWVYAALGRAYNNMARWEDAQRALEVALRLDPKLWQAHYEAARADAGQHKHDAALRHIQAATAIGAADSDEIAALNALILAKAQESRLH